MNTTIHFPSYTARLINAKTHLALIVMVLVAAPQLAVAQATNCLPQPVLTLSQQATNNFWLDVSGTPGLNYAIERSEDFAQWTRVATNRSSSGMVRFAPPVLATVQFFRALAVNAADGLGGAFIFDGGSFAGWEGETLQTFRISDCSIVGGSLAEALPENRYLCTTRQYTNFILRLEFKIVGTNANSGVQFRSVRIPNGPEVSGYQADMVTGFWGSLYDEHRRGTVLAAANQAAVMAVLRTNDWNSYVIQAEGARVRFWINGYQTIDYSELNAAIPRNGIIGFQLRSGRRFEAAFRYISLEVLP